MKKLKSVTLDLELDPCRGSEGADGSQVVWRRNIYSWATQFYIMQDKIITNLKDRYDNKESSVIYDMASIIDDKSVADQVVQRVVRYCVLQHGWGSDVLRCAQMFNQFKLLIKMNLKALFVSWFYIKRRINVSSKVSSKII